MTWTLNASGHTPAPDGAQGWAEVEQELHDELLAVLSKPKYGMTTSHFAGNHVQGTVTSHDEAPAWTGAVHADTEAAPDPETASAANGS